jgi:hypothetical protein
MCFCFNNFLQILYSLMMAYLKSETYTFRFSLTNICSVRQIIIDFQTEIIAQKLHVPLELTARNL